MHVCKDFGVKSICEHGKQRVSCNDCGFKCSSCKITHVRKKNAKCRHCLPIAKTRSKNKEAAIAAMLGQWASEGYIPLYTSWDKGNPDAKPGVCGRYRPDFVWDLGFRALVLEIDEFQHKHENYVQRCELVRVSRIVEGYGGIPVHIIRYNPDAFKINGVTRVTKREERLALLRLNLAEAVDRPDLENQIVVQHIWFDQDTPADNFAVTQKFQTLEAYETWVETVSPATPPDDGQ